MEGLARLLLALLVLVLLLQVIEHGPGGAATWLRAWFLGDATAAGKAQASAKAQTTLRQLWGTG